jgi:RNA polymerase sigma-70 factor (ECF subfamily)
LQAPFLTRLSPWHTDAALAMSGPHGNSEVVGRAVQALQAGQRTEESFRVLHQTYYQPVQRFFAKRLGSTDESLDLTQETFLRIYQGVKGFRGDAPFGAWVYRIAWNVLHRYTSRGSAVHRPGRQVSLEDPEAMPADAGSNPNLGRGGDEDRAFARVLHRERLEILRQAIEKLPPQRRRCLVLWAFQGQTYEQIATALRLSLGTVKAHLAQARKQLESLVEESRSEP